MLVAVVWVTSSQPVRVTASQPVRVTASQSVTVSPQYVLEKFHHRLSRLLIEWVPELARSLHGPCAVQVVHPGGRYQGNDDCQ